MLQLGHAERDRGDVPEAYMAWNMHPGALRGVSLVAVI